MYTRISAGMSLDDIATIYGNIRKITLFAIEDGVGFIEEISKTLDDEIIQRRKMVEIEHNNPVVARTMKEMANEYAPDVGKSVSLLSVKLIKKASELISEEDCTTNDLQNIAKAVQTMTDTIELTQRHSTVGGNTINNIQVEGFTFELDEPTEIKAIEAEIEVSVDG